MEYKTLFLLNSDVPLHEAPLRGTEKCLTQEGKESGVGFYLEEDKRYRYDKEKGTYLRRFFRAQNRSGECGGGHIRKAIEGMTGQVELATKGTSVLGVVAVMFVRAVIEDKLLQQQRYPGETFRLRKTKGISVHKFPKTHNAIYDTAAAIFCQQKIFKKSRRKGNGDVRLDQRAQPCPAGRHTGGYAENCRYHEKARSAH
jgi:hypothetical protein